MSEARSKFGELDLDAIGLERADRSPPVADGAEHTRIAVATVLADAIARSGQMHDDGPSSQRSPPSTSGVAARSRHADPVGAIRALYADGRADLALALASELTSELEQDSSADDPYGGLIPIEDDVDVDVDVENEDARVVAEGDSEADRADCTMMLDAATNSSRLAAMTSRRIPHRRMGPRQVSALPMDPRMGFLLGHIDGVQTMEEILDVCAMPEADALELLERLRAMGAISIE